MRVYYQDEYVTIYNCDNREIINDIVCFDIVVTSPPYNMRTRVSTGK